MRAARLLGDADVRRPPHIRGIHSGFRAGGKRFIYDATRGLAKHSYEGAAGAAKGVGAGSGTETSDSGGRGRISACRSEGAGEGAGDEGC